MEPAGGSIPRESAPAWALSEEQSGLLAYARRVAAKELTGLVTRAPEGRVNRALVAALAQHGLLARLFPASLGGTGADKISALDICLLREGLAQGSVEAETALALQGLGAHPIVQSGEASVARRWVPLVARGEAIAAFALSEPEAGSDAAALRLTAEREGDDWRLTGVKTWISNAPDADVYTVFARTSEERARGVSAFVVPGDSPGLSGRSLELVAPHAVGRLELDGVRVARDALVGEVGGGFRVAMATLDLFRPSVGAGAVGMAAVALETARAYAGERVTFERPLKEHQSVAHRLADMATAVEAARLLVYSAAAAYDRGANVTKAAAMAKLFATERAQEVVDSAVQILGARGLERGHLLERLYREVRAPRIYEGASEIQREIIARELYRD